MNMKLITFAFLALAMSKTLANEPLMGSDLLRSCESVQTNSATEIESMLCIWYITPCDCGNYDEDVPRVCLPSGVAEQRLASIIIRDLQNDQGLQSASAKFAANTVLARYFPCRK